MPRSWRRLTSRSSHWEVTPPRSLPAFEIQPPVQGRGEWINTSTYIFYPEPAMAGGTEYTVSLDMNLKTASGVGWSGTERIAWTFTTSRPNVVMLEPSVMELLPLDPEIKLTFNQPMDTESVESNFSFSGTEGALTGEFLMERRRNGNDLRPE